MKSIKQEANDLELTFMNEIESDEEETAGKKIDTFYVRCYLLLEMGLKSEKVFSK